MDEEILPTGVVIGVGNREAPRLGFLAPLACYEDGSVTEAETDQGGATATDREDSESDAGEATPKFTLPRERKAEATLEYSEEQARMPSFDQGAMELVGVKSPQQEEEAKAALLLQQESLDLEPDDYQTTLAAVIAHSTPRPDSMFIPVRPEEDIVQLRKQYEAQAVSRPRSTTPVRVCAIEDFIAAVEDDKSASATIPADPEEKMKISLPHDTATTDRSRPRRRSSMTWSDFYESMSHQMPMQVAATKSTYSGRYAAEADLLDQNPDYQDKVPPSPVVHRRSSTDWVVFQDEEKSAVPEAMDTNPFASAVAATDRKVPEVAPSPPVPHPQQHFMPPDEPVPTLAPAADPYAQPSTVTAPVSGVFDYQPSEYYGDSWAELRQADGSDFKNQPPADWALPCAESYQTAELPEVRSSSHSSAQFQVGFSDDSSTMPAYNAADESFYSAYQSQTDSYAGDIPPEPYTATHTDMTASLGQTPDTGYTTSDSSYAHNYGTQQDPSWDSLDQSNTTTISDQQTSWDQSASYMAEQKQTFGQGSTTEEPVAAGYGATQQHTYAGQSPFYAESQQKLTGSYNAPDSWDTTYYCATVPLVGQQPTAPISKTSDPYGDSWGDSYVAPSYQPPPQTDTVNEPTIDKAQENVTPEPVADPVIANPVIADNADDWKKYLSKSEDMVKKTQEKLKQMEETTTAKNLPDKPYELRSPTPPPPENLMDMDLQQAAKEVSTDKSDWKPISQVLNDEIKKQKELNKPKRPPPPKGGAPPKRPPPPRASPAPGQTPSSTNKVGRQDYQKTAVSGGWDDPQTADFYANVPSYAGNTSIVPDVMGVSGTITESQASKTGQFSANVNQYSTPAPALPEVPVGVSGLEESASYPPPPPLPPMSNMEAYDSIPPSDELPPPPAEYFKQAILDSNKAIDEFGIVDQQKAAEPADNLQDELESFLGAGGSSAGRQPPIKPSPSPVQDWTGFDSTTGLKPSDSDFFGRLSSSSQVIEVNAQTRDPFAPPKPIDPFASLAGDDSLLLQQSYDPFDIKPAEELVSEAKAKVLASEAAAEAKNDLDFFGDLLSKPSAQNGQDQASTPTEEGGSIAGDRPAGFEDEFQPEAKDDEEDRSPSPLFEEDDSAPLEEFPPKFTGDGWELMLRHPLKKKLMSERYWKPVYIRVVNNMVQLFNSQKDQRPFQELPLQANYSLSDVVLQQYDVYGKIHTAKLQYVMYKERVGIRPGQIPRLVEGQFTKLGLPLEHAAQSNQLLKFGSLNVDDIQTFVRTVEDVLFHCIARREGSVLYKQDEVQIHCYDEYAAHVNKDGIVSNQRARVRLFCLAFVSGMPSLEIGLNDRRRQGKEVVRRKDILPMYTERWIRFEALEFHNTVSQEAFEKDHVIKLMPPDGCFFEIMRFRVRPPRAKELPLQVRAIMKIAGSKIEIRLECMVAAFRSRKARQVPCEDIQLRFPIPEAWIYLFREERHWGYGSVHARIKRPGKVKNIRDRIMGAVQQADSISLMEAAIGDAKYEHVYRSIVWRIPRLPEKHHGAYKNHLLRCRFELSSFDLMPETFLPTCDVEFTMPMATVSHTVVRSVSLDRHEDPDRVEKYVRYVAKYQYQVEVDYVQTTELDMDAVMDATVVDPELSLDKSPAAHKPSIDINVAKEAHTGYRMNFTDAEFGGTGRRDSSSSDEGDGEKKKNPFNIQIDMSGYGY